MPAYSTVVSELLNSLGRNFWTFSVVMFVETVILFLIIGTLDLMLLRRQRTIVRYGVWLLLLFKLVLPTSLPGPWMVFGINERVWTQPLLQFISASVPLGIQNADLGQGDQDGSFDPIQPSRGELESAQFQDLVEVSASHGFDDEVSGHGEDREKIHWQGWLLLLWIGMVGSLAVLFVRRIFQVRELIRSSAEANAELQTLFEETQRDIQWSSSRVQIRCSQSIHSPAICGFWKTTILIPVSLPAALSRGQLRQVLIHELIHQRNGDLYWEAFQTLLQIVYFYNPLLWFTNSLLRRLREYCVDEETILRAGTSAEGYATTLVDVTSLSQRQQSIPALSVGVMESRSVLARRVNRMLTRELTSTTGVSWRGSVALCVLALLLLPLAGCHGLEGFANDSTSSIDDEFDLELDSRSVSALQDRLDGSAGKMLQLEELTERRLSSEGYTEPRLTAAGITQSASDELVGLVVDDRLRPVAGVTVDAYHWASGNEATTDDQGIFRIKELDPDKAPPLLLTKQGYSPRLVTGRFPGQKDVLIILGHQTCLEGLVTGLDNKPVAGARIVATSGSVEYSPGHHLGSVPFETLSDRDGHYRLDVFASKYDLKVLTSGAGVARVSGVVVEPNQSVACPLPLQSGIRFEAVVVDSQTGQPFEGFTLFTTTSPQISGKSDRNGRLVLEDLFPGIIDFRCGAGEKVSQGDVEYWTHGTLGRWWSPDALHRHQKRYFQPYLDGASRAELLWQHNNGELTFLLSSDQKPVKIVVEQGVTVRGTVTDPHGKPVPGARVSATLHGRPGILSGNLYVMTDEQGRYQSVLPASGKHKYNMVAHDGKSYEWRHWSNGISKPLQTEAGQAFENVDLVLTVPGTIRGKITSLGKPVSNRVVYSQSFNGCEDAHCNPPSRTGPDGSFEIKFVSPGKHYVLTEPRYSPPDFDPKGFRVVEVKPGEVAEIVELDIKGL